MIARQIVMKAVKKSDFASLVKYITDEQNKNERVGSVAVTNCQSDRSDVAVTEVLNTQAQNTRARSDKTYHLVISFRAGEQPVDAILTAIEARICAGLGYGEHQRVSAVHHDTDNLHIHLAINKIHPTRYTLHEPYNDHKTLGQLCEKLENEFRLEKDNHQAHKRGAQNRATDMEHHAGVESLLGWIQRECHEQMQGAQSWAALHQVMQAHGLELRERGNGLVIVAEDGTSVKASSVGRAYSRNQLQDRFGDFETSSEPAVGPSPQSSADRQPGQPPDRTYERKPMRSGINTQALYASYQNEQQGGNALRATQWRQAMDRKTRGVEAARRSGRLKRAVIKLIKGAGPGKKILYAATTKSLREEIQKVNQQYLKERQQSYEKYRRLSWVDWLRARAADADQEAMVALRARENAQKLKGNSVAGTPGQPGRTPHHSHHLLKTDATPDSITKKGTIIYRVGPTVVRDDGDKLQVSRGASLQGLQAALRMALVRYGPRITVNGSAAFQEQIAQAAANAQLPLTFDDAALERRRQILLQPITPQERVHEHERDRTETKPSDAGRADRRGHGGPGLAPARGLPAATTAHSTTGRGRPAYRVPTAPPHHQHVKPDVGRIGRKPPPPSQNRLRGLSELGVVQLQGRGEVLLPGHVPGHVEQQGATPDHGVRRAVSGAGIVTAGQAAAVQYVAERETSRLKIMDIPKYRLYTDENFGVATFAGIRQVDRQALVLLKRDEEIMVLPIDAATARRLSRVAVGQGITVTPQGAIRTKGKSR